MKTKIISTTKRVANFALGLPIVITALVSQTHASDSNFNHYKNQEHYYNIVQMMPVDPIIDAINQTKLEIKNKIEFENSSINNEVKEIALSNYKIQEQGLKTEDRITFLEQRFNKFEQETLSLLQQLLNQMQQQKKYPSSRMRHITVLSF